MRRTPTAVAAVLLLGAAAVWYLRWVRRGDEQTVDQTDDSGMKG